MADPNLRLALEPLSPDVPPAPVDGDEAIAIAQQHLNAPVDPAWVERGMGVVTTEGDQVTATESVWLVVVENPDPEPYPIGPYCPDEPDGQCSWAIDAFGVAMVSDQSGQIVRGASIMQEVEGPGESRAP